MSYQKLVHLVHKVASSTRDGSLSWKETEVDGVFQVSFVNSSIRIGERRSKIDANASEYYLKIFNSEGDEIEEIGDEDGADNDERSDMYQSLKEAYEVARRQSSGVEETLDDILRELDKGIPLF